MPEREPQAQGNPFLWLGPLIAIAGFVSYWGFFVRWPLFRDTAWLNIGILLVALFLSVQGLRRAWPRGGWRRLAGAGSATVSGLLLGLLVFYCYGMSYGLPSDDGAVAEGAAIPPVTLASHDGSPVDLSQAAQETLVLVFYRGHW